MSKFVVKKRFELGFLSEEWKDAYLVFAAFTISDIKERLTRLAGVDQTDQTQIASGLDEMVTLLEEKFVEGKGVDEKGEVVAITKHDIKDLPVEVIAKAVSFLSQGLTPQS